MTASAAPRRSGVAGAGPPSWKIVSTTTASLRMAISGMGQFPPGGIGQGGQVERAGPALEMDGAGADEPARLQSGGPVQPGGERFRDLRFAEPADMARHG